MFSGSVKCEVEGQQHRVGRKQVLTGGADATEYWDSRCSLCTVDPDWALLLVQTAALEFRTPAQGSNLALQIVSP